jgi:hypothetical protein
MKEFLVFLEQTEFSQWVREGQTIWAFPTILVLHTIGMAIVAGGSAMISLIVLGFWPAAPIRPFARVFPYMWVAFGVNAVTGTMMLVADATAKLATLDFYIKMALVFAGFLVLIRMRRRIFEDPELDQVPLSGNAKMLAWASLACWFGAIVAGRLMAYVGPAVPGAH